MILQGSLRHQFLLPASRIRERSSRVRVPVSADAGGIDKDRFKLEQH
jgi:hypothetical protein